MGWFNSFPSWLICRLRHELDLCWFDAAHTNDCCLIQVGFQSKRNSISRQILRIYVFHRKCITTYLPKSGVGNLQHWKCHLCDAIRLCIMRHPPNRHVRKVKAGNATFATAATRDNETAPPSLCTLLTWIQTCDGCVGFVERWSCKVVTEIWTAVTISAVQTIKIKTTNTFRSFCFNAITEPFINQWK